MRRNCVNQRSTVEELAANCLDVRELSKVGALDGGWVTFRWPEFRWPKVRNIRFSRYLIQIELLNQVVVQQVPVSWTPCNYGAARPSTVCAGGVWHGYLEGSVGIIAARAAETRFMKAKSVIRRRGPTCRPTEPDSSLADRVREWILYQSVLIA